MRSSGYILMPSQYKLLLSAGRPLLLDRFADLLGQQTPDGQRRARTDLLIVLVDNLAHMLGNHAKLLHHTQGGEDITCEMHEVGAGKSDHHVWLFDLDQYQ